LNEIEERRKVDQSGIDIFVAERTVKTQYKMLGNAEQLMVA